MKVSNQNTNSMSLSDCTPVAIFYHHNLLSFNEPLQFIAMGSDCTGGHHWEQVMISIIVESVKGLKINTTEMNTSIAGKLLIMS